jgi:hypothetical protein
MANLIYTMALEQAGTPGHRMLGKLLASSLLRTFFDGDMVIFKNSDVPDFQVERRGLAEVTVDLGLKSDETSFAVGAWSEKYAVRKDLDVRGV